MGEIEHGYRENACWVNAKPCGRRERAAEHRKSLCTQFWSCLVWFGTPKWLFWKFTTWGGGSLVEGVVHCFPPWPREKSRTQNVFASENALSCEGATGYTVELIVGYIHQILLVVHPQRGHRIRVWKKMYFWKSSISENFKKTTQIERNQKGVAH